MSTASLFIGGAKDRLLPPSVPFRFFGAATGFHVLFWLVLLFAAADLPGFTGGPGLVLAALHLATLGVLAMTAMGAAFQLLPVATRQPLVRTWPARLSFWLFAPATLSLAYGMAEAAPGALYLGGGGVGAGLAVFALLTADNLRRAGSLPVVAAHGWLALAAAVGFTALGLLLVADLGAGFLGHRQTYAAAHMVLAAFGFMGALAFGFSHVLIPMFALSRALPARPGWLELALTAAAVALATWGLLGGYPAVVTFAALTGLAAAATYLWLMREAFRSRMRKRLGLSFVLIRISWGFLILGLLTGLAVVLGAPLPNGPTLFGFLTLAGWLLTFLMGILQRIMPFLASMHATGKGGKPPSLSELTAQLPLNIHATGHVIALALCAAGIVADAPVLVRLGAVCGLIGALSFAVFAAQVIIRISAAATAPRQGAPGLPPGFPPDSDPPSRR
ncbi:MAG: hypothetical protein ACE5FS_06980 [Paracoccaceae bacterium]